MFRRRCNIYVGTYMTSRWIILYIMCYFHPIPYSNTSAQNTRRSRGVSSCVTRGTIKCVDDNTTCRAQPRHRGRSVSLESERTVDGRWATNRRSEKYEWTGKTNHVMWDTRSSCVTFLPRPEEIYNVYRRNAVVDQ